MQDIAEAWARYARGDLWGAAALSRRLLSAAPNDAAALTCHAVSTWALDGNAEACLVQLRQAVELVPAESWIRHNLGTVLAALGRLDDARSSYLKALELKPDDTQAFYGLTQISKFTTETDLVRQMLERYSSGDLEQRDEEYLCFALAKVYDALGRYQRAIHFCIEGNWLANRQYDVEGPRADLAELREMVAAGAFAGITPASATTSARPVFIVGMPRSGTTLMETILSRHPAVHAGGEMQHMAEVESALLAWARQQQGYRGGPHRMLAGVPKEFLSRNAAAVVSRVEAAAGERSFSVFTDKLPDNALRLGLISLVFPDARVIHMRRHPLDCCVSILFLHFMRGAGYAFRQSTLGERYRQVAETMELWKAALRLPILDVSYESLVASPEPEIRRVLDFAGLPWDEACLHPERAARAIATANQRQVRQPINGDSVGRWRRYEEWLQPLIKSLGGFEWIEAQQQAGPRAA